MRHVGRPPLACFFSLIVVLASVSGDSLASARKFEEILGLNGTTAILVGGVEPGMLAERAGLQTGDVILKFNGQGLRAFTHYRSFLESMRQAAFHGGASLDVMRYDAVSQRYFPRQVSLRLETAPADAEQIYLGIRATPTFFVLDVSEGSSEKRLGLSSGDFIEEVNGQGFVSPGDLDRLGRAIEASPDRAVALWVTRWVPVENGKVGGKNTRLVQGTLGN